jgi:hypothetical protein
MDIPLTVRPLQIKYGRTLGWIQLLMVQIPVLLQIPCVLALRKAGAETITMIYFTIPAIAGASLLGYWVQRLFQRYSTECATSIVDQIQKGIIKQEEVEATQRAVGDVMSRPIPDQMRTALEGPSVLLDEPDPNYYCRPIRMVGERHQKWERGRSKKDVADDIKFCEAHEMIEKGRGILHALDMGGWE